MAGLREDRRSFGFGGPSCYIALVQQLQSIMPILAHSVVHPHALFVSDNGGRLAPLSKHDQTQDAWRIKQRTPKE